MRRREFIIVLPGFTISNAASVAIIRAETADIDCPISELGTVQGLSCAPGVEREIFSSSSFMSADTSAKRGVLK